MALLMCLALLLPGAALAKSAPARLIPVAVKPGRQISPRTDGRFVVWVDEAPDQLYKGELQAFDLVTGRTFSLGAGPRKLQSSPDVDAGVAVWEQTDLDCPQCMSDIWGMDLLTGRTFAIATTHEDETRPQISGHYVAWWSSTGYMGERRLLLGDLTSQAAPRQLMNKAESHYVSYDTLLFDGGRLVWGWHIVSSHSSNYERWTYVVGSAAPQRIDNQDLRLYGRIQALAGDSILTQISPTASTLALVNLATGVMTGTSIMEQSAGSATSDGRFIFWLVSSHSAPRSDLFGYDTWRVGSSFQFAQSNSDAEYNGNLAVSNGLLVFTRGIETSDVYALRVADTLPSAPRTDPHAPDCDYSVETQHTLCAPFRGFWHGNGGLPVFGYPLHEAYQEQSAETGKIQLTQYFERERLEHHPQHAGTPYEIQLGRLGADLLGQRGVNWQSLPKADPQTPHYMPETGHAIAEQFWGYWRSHGLEFGDAGVSFREALALFGFPLSEPSMETNSSGDRVLTQWFERARFEYHPGNPEPYKVLLGRLGAEVVASRDW